MFKSESSTERIMTFKITILDPKKRDIFGRDTLHLAYFQHL